MQALLPFLSYILTYKNLDTKMHSFELRIFTQFPDLVTSLSHPEPKAFSSSWLKMPPFSDSSYDIQFN